MPIFRRNTAKGPFYAPHYGLVRDDEVAVDPTFRDTELADAIGAARRGDWKPAAQAIVDAGTDWDRRMVRVQALADETKNTTAWLDHWRTAEPDSPEAAVVHAQALVILAWSVRGGQRGNQTTQEQFQGFERILRDADSAALRAIDLAPQDPTPWVARITAARGLATPNDEFTGLWKELIARAPLHRRGHAQALQYWCAKWCGSDDLVTTFVAQTSALHPRTALAVDVNVQLLQERWLSISDKTEQANYHRSQYGWPILEAALWHWDGAIPTGHAYELLDRNLLAWALTMALRYDEACDLFEAVGGRICSSYPWIYHGNVRRAFVELREEAFQKSSRQPYMTF